MVFTCDQLPHRETLKAASNFSQDCLFVSVTETKTVLFCLCEKSYFRSCRLYMYLSILYNKDTHYPVTFSRIQTIVYLYLQFPKGKFSQMISIEIVCFVIFHVHQGTKHLNSSSKFCMHNTLNCLTE